MERGQFPFPVEDPLFLGSSLSTVCFSAGPSLGCGTQAGSTGDIACLRTSDSLHWLEENESNVILFLVTVHQRGSIVDICLATPHFYVKGRRG